MSTCPTCGGPDGFHAVFCLPNMLADRLLNPVFDRLFGPGAYTWLPPAADRRPAVVAAVAGEQLPSSGSEEAAAAADVPAELAELRSRVRLQTETIQHDGEELRRLRRELADAKRPKAQDVAPRGQERAVPVSADGAKQPTAADRARKWLVDYLTEQGGSALSSDVIGAGKVHKISENALRKARHGVATLRITTTYPSRTYWVLPDAETPVPTRPSEKPDEEGGEAPSEAEKEAMAEYATEASQREEAPQGSAGATVSLLRPPPPQTEKQRLAAERDAALDLFIAEHIAAAEDTASISNPQLVEAYELWRARSLPDAPALTNSMDLGYAMKRAGHHRRKRQARSADLRPDGQRYGYTGPKPTLYFGLAIRGIDAEPAPKEPSQSRDDVAEIRDLMQRAKASRPSRVVRPGYEGDLPGREVGDPRDREMVTKLIDQGWTYRKNNGNGKGKPRVINPRGHVFTLANTPSDRRNHLNTRAVLRRMGAAL